MATVSYNPQDFHLQTKHYEQQAIASAEAKAREIALSQSGLKVHKESRRICNEAYETFEKEIQNAFPYDTYADLISMTLKSRQNLFFSDLKERVMIIFRAPGGQ